MRRVLLVAFGSVAAWGTHCNYNDYPLEPTFCDDWCRVLLRSNCDQEPENCVRSCEQSSAPAACFDRQAVLLSCYQATSPSEFVCSGQGFQQIARPEERVCQPERDALIDCAYPEVKRCLDICRAVEASYADGSSDAQAPSARTCPSYDIPCDSICWIAGREFTLPRHDGGDAADGVSDAGSGLGELAEELIACALQRAEACRSGDAGDAGDASVKDANWSSVLLECARELGL